MLTAKPNSLPCRLLVEHAQSDPAAAAFLQASLEFVINQNAFDGCQILLEAGTEANTVTLYRAMNWAARQKRIAICQLLVNHPHHVDPFLQQGTGSSPFLAAAQQADTRIFEYFLELWDE